MTVRLEGDVVRLEGDCRLEEAEALAALICDHPERVVDLSMCRLMHSALVQVLLSFAPAVRGDPDDAFLRDFVTPILRRPSEGPDARDYLERQT